MTPEESRKKIADALAKKKAAEAQQAAVPATPPVPVAPVQVKAPVPAKPRPAMASAPAPAPAPAPARYLMSPDEADRTIRAEAPAPRLVTPPAPEEPRAAVSRTESLPAGDTQAELRALRESAIAEWNAGWRAKYEEAQRAGTAPATSTWADNMAPAFNPEKAEGAAAARLRERTAEVNAKVESGIPPVARKIATDLVQNNVSPSSGEFYTTYTDYLIKQRGGDSSALSAEQRGAIRTEAQRDARAALLSLRQVGAWPLPIYQDEVGAGEEPGWLDPRVLMTPSGQSVVTESPGMYVLRNAFGVLQVPVAGAFREAMGEQDVTYFDAKRNLRMDSPFAAVIEGRLPKMREWQEEYRRWDDVYQTLRARKDAGEVLTPAEQEEMERAWEKQDRAHANITYTTIIAAGLDVLVPGVEGLPALAGWVRGTKDAALVARRIKAGERVEDIVVDMRNKAAADVYALSNDPTVDPATQRMAADRASEVLGETPEGRALLANMKEGGKQRSTVGQVERDLSAADARVQAAKAQADSTSTALREAREADAEAVSMGQTPALSAEEMVALATQDDIASTALRHAEESRENMRALLRGLDTRDKLVADASRKAYEDLLGTNRRLSDPEPMPASAAPAPAPAPTPAVAKLVPPKDVTVADLRFLSNPDRDFFGGLRSLRAKNASFADGLAEQVLRDMGMPVRGSDSNPVEALRRVLADNPEKAAQRGDNARRALATVEEQLGVLEDSGITDSTLRGDIAEARNNVRKAREELAAYEKMLVGSKDRPTTAPYQQRLREARERVRASEAAVTRAKNAKEASVLRQLEQAARDAERAVRDFYRPGAAPALLPEYEQRVAAARKSMQEAQRAATAAEKQAAKAEQHAASAAQRAGVQDAQEKLKAERETLRLIQQSLRSPKLDADYVAAVRTAEQELASAERALSAAKGLAKRQAAESLVQAAQREVAQAAKDLAEYRAAARPAPVDPAWRAELAEAKREARAAQAAADTAGRRSDAAAIKAYLDDLKQKAQAAAARVAELKTKPKAPSYTAEWRAELAEAKREARAAQAAADTAEKRASMAATRAHLDDLKQKAQAADSRLKAVSTATKDKAPVLDPAYVAERDAAQVRMEEARAAAVGGQPGAFASVEYSTDASQVLPALNMGNSPRLPVPAALSKEEAAQTLTNALTRAYGKTGGGAWLQSPAYTSLHNLPLVVDPKPGMFGTTAAESIRVGRIETSELGKKLYTALDSRLSVPGAEEARDLPTFFRNLDIYSAPGIDPHAVRVGDLVVVDNPAAFSSVKNPTAPRTTKLRYEGDRLVEKVQGYPAGEPPPYIFAEVTAIEEGGAQLPAVPGKKRPKKKKTTGTTPATTERRVVVTVQDYAPGSGLVSRVEGQNPVTISISPADARLARRGGASWGGAQWKGLKDTEDAELGTLARSVRYGDGRIPPRLNPPKPPTLTTYDYRPVVTVAENPTLRGAADAARDAYVALRDTPRYLDDTQVVQDARAAAQDARTTYEAAVVEATKPVPSQEEVARLRQEADAAAARVTALEAQPRLVPANEALEDARAAAQEARATYDTAVAAVATPAPSQAEIARLRQAADEAAARVTALEAKPRAPAVDYRERALAQDVEQARRDLASLRASQKAPPADVAAAEQAVAVKEASLEQLRATAAQNVAREPAEVLAQRARVEQAASELAARKAAALPSSPQGDDALRAQELEQARATLRTAEDALRDLEAAPLYKTDDPGYQEAMRRAEEARGLVVDAKAASAPGTLDEAQRVLAEAQDALRTLDARPERIDPVLEAERARTLVESSEDRLLAARSGVTAPPGTPEYQSAVQRRDALRKVIEEESAARATLARLDADPGKRLEAIRASVQAAAEEPVKALTEQAAETVAKLKARSAEIRAAKSSGSAGRLLPGRSTPSSLGEEDYLRLASEREMVHAMLQKQGSASYRADLGHFVDKVVDYFRSEREVAKDTLGSGELRAILRGISADEAEQDRLVILALKQGRASGNSVAPGIVHAELLPDTLASGLYSEEVMSAAELAFLDASRFPATSEQAAAWRQRLRASLLSDGTAEHRLASLYAESRKVNEEFLANNPNSATLLRPNEYGFATGAKLLGAITTQARALGDLRTAVDGYAYLGKTDAEAVASWMSATGREPSTQRGRDILLKAGVDPTKYKTPIDSLASFWGHEGVTRQAQSAYAKVRTSLPAMARLDEVAQAAAQEIYIPVKIQERLDHVMNQAITLAGEEKKQFPLAMFLLRYWKQNLTLGIGPVRSLFLISNWFNDLDQMIAHPEIGASTAIKVSIRNLFGTLLGATPFSPVALASAAQLAKKPVGVLLRDLLRSVDSVVDTVVGADTKLTNRARAVVGRDPLPLTPYGYNVGTVLSRSNDVVELGGKKYTGYDLYRTASGGGVLEGHAIAEFTESLRESLHGNLGWYKLVDTIPSLNKDVAEVIQQRQRVGLYLALIDNGFEPVEAARITREALLDYQGTLHPIDRHWVIGVVAPFWNFRKNNARRTYQTLLTRGAAKAGMWWRGKKVVASALSKWMDERDPYGFDVDAMKESGVYEQYMQGIEAAAAAGLSPAQVKRLLAIGKSCGVEDLDTLSTDYFAADPVQASLPEYAQGRIVAWNHMRKNATARAYMNAGGATKAGEQPGDDWQGVLVPDDSTFSAISEALAVASFAYNLGAWATGDPGAKSRTTAAAVQSFGDPSTHPVSRIVLAGVGATAPRPGRKLPPNVGKLLTSIGLATLDAKSGYESADPATGEMRDTYTMPDIVNALFDVTGFLDPALELAIGTDTLVSGDPRARDDLTTETGAGGYGIGGMRTMQASWREAAAGADKAANARMMAAMPQGDTATLRPLTPTQVSAEQVHARVEQLGRNQQTFLQMPESLELVTRIARGVQGAEDEAARFKIEDEMHLRSWLIIYNHMDEVEVAKLDRQEVQRAWVDQNRVLLENWRVDAGSEPR